MKLKTFIQKLEKISNKYGNDTEVILADNVSISNSVFSKKYPSGKSVVITDKR